MSNVDFNLYLITDRKQVKGNLIDAVEDALKAGVKAVQLREKDITVRELMELSKSMKILTDQYKAKLFINDRVDVALCAGADGVHLGQSSMPADAVKRIAKDKLLIGVSTHGVEEAIKAQKNGADFITLGPVYKTPSKIKYGEPVGIEILEDVKDLLRIPVFAIGGIKPENLSELKKTGADGVAVISGILSSENIYASTRNYMELLQ